MQTIASLAKRLDMTAEEAVEKLRYMKFDVSSVNDEISDEQCDLLIDVDEDDSVADEYLKEKIEEEKKEERRKERLKKAAKKAAAKRKTKAKTKAKAKAKAKSKTEEPSEDGTELGAGVADEDEADRAETMGEGAGADQAQGAPVAEIVEESAEHEEDRPVAEILPPVTPETESSEEAEGPKEPAIRIGSAIERETHAVEIVRADGTHVDAPEVEFEEEATREEGDEEEDESSVIAQAELKAEEEERKARSKPLPKPDPAVVAEVIRRASERGQKARRPAPGRTRNQDQDEAPARVAAAPQRTGKTARKRQKKAERMRAEQDLRREAAAAVREYQSMGTAGVKRRKRRRSREEGDYEGMDQTPQTIEVAESMTVEELATAMDMPVNDIILSLMDLNIMATKNQSLSTEVVRQIAEPEGFEVKAVIPEEDEVLAEEPDKPEDLLPRAPVVTVMGHVDHGKTSLLDRVREANVAAGEAGGITQHIAAYEVKIDQGRVVFLDTPGHAAFTKMRARGAQCTDIVVLVVAADDGVMPQTIEAIDHAKAAEVPIVVAVNKCDKPNAQPERIRQELTQHELVDEQWGGKTIIKDISALTGDGVSELMELLVLEAEMLELKANPNKKARGTIVESEISRGLGPVAWVLVQTGTLRIGDVFLAGDCYGRVRSMQNARGEDVEEAGPSTPVVVTGFSGPPDAGDTFVVLEEERVARTIAEKRAELAKQRSQRRPHVTLEDFHDLMMAGEKKELNVVIKADVQGSVDVLETSFQKIGNEEVKVTVVHSGVGGVNESDVLLASASDAVVIGFHVTANARVQKLAEEEGVEIRTYRVIYEAIDAVRSALEGMLAPESREVVIGHVEIRQIFRSSAVGNIAGCYVLDGEVSRGSLVRITRDDVIIYDGKIATLRREKDDAKTVQSGFECGIRLERFDDIKEGDIIEVYKLEEVAKTLK